MTKSNEQIDFLDGRRSQEAMNQVAEATLSILQIRQSAMAGNLMQSAPPPYRDCSEADARIRNCYNFLVAIGRTRGGEKEPEEIMEIFHREDFLSIANSADLAFIDTRRGSDEADAMQTRLMSAFLHAKHIGELLMPEGKKPRASTHFYPSDDDPRIFVGEGNRILDQHIVGAPRAEGSEQGDTGIHVLSLRRRDTFLVPVGVLARIMTPRQQDPSTNYVPLSTFGLNSFQVDRLGRAEPDTRPVASTFYIANRRQPLS